MSDCPRCLVPGALIAPRVLCLNFRCECYHQPSRRLYQEALFRGDLRFSGDLVARIRLALWRAEERAPTD